MLGWVDVCVPLLPPELAQPLPACLCPGAGSTQGLLDEGLLDEGPAPATGEGLMLQLESSARLPVGFLSAWGHQSSFYSGLQLIG